MLTRIISQYEQMVTKIQAAILLNEALSNPDRNKDKVDLESFINDLKSNG